MMAILTGARWHPIAGLTCAPLMASDQERLEGGSAFGPPAGSGPEPSLKVIQTAFKTELITVGAVAFTKLRIKLLHSVRTQRRHVYSFVWPSVMMSLPPLSEGQPSLEVS